jgi:hypothetical protein
LFQDPNTQQIPKQVRDDPIRGHLIFFKVSAYSILFDIKNNEFMPPQIPPIGGLGGRAIQKRTLEFGALPQINFTHFTKP